MFKMRSKASISQPISNSTPRSSRRFSLHRKASTATAPPKSPAFPPPESASTATAQPKSPGFLPPESASSVRGVPSRGELLQVFKKFDANNDGKISSSELQSLMAALGSQASDAEIASMMREADTDGDGFINFEEFIESNTKGVSNAHLLKDLENAFKMYDLDKNGAISVEELHKVLKSLGEGTSLQECRQMIKGVDKDADGSINLEEFKIMMNAPH
uniref:TSA: Wollemia nobilis Ref_Wollemi_Transcript_13984_875 transcribed RNA sequence n=1 Tax=Wollemia nobilis TaxID=56998 RepID=A0A0C9S737_9CONI